MADYLGLVAQCEHLYRDVCFDPSSWPDSSLSDWIDGIAQSGHVEKEIARELRRVLRAAQKLRTFWGNPPSSLPPDHGDFRTRVDIGLGVKAWRPLLAISQFGLHHSPGPDLYEDVKERFRVVFGERWMEGVGYDEWLAQGSS